MKIDKKTINMVLKLNDDALWSVIEKVISKSGVSSLKNMERPKDMTKIRETLNNLTDEDIEKALKLFGKDK